jgi:hypothetical protein
MISRNLADENMNPDSTPMPSLRLTMYFAVIFLVLCGCAVSRQVSFNEADFVGTSGHGSGVAAGSAYAIVNAKKLDAGNATVVLTPVNAYTTENVRRRFVNGENLQSADSRIDKYLRSATTDAQGNFAIRDIRPGEYYVESRVEWTTSYVEVFERDQSTSTMYSDHDKLIFGRVSVKNNQTVHVTNWDQSSQVHDQFYAYGGVLSRPHHRLVTSP